MVNMIPCPLLRFWSGFFKKYSLLSVLKVFSNFGSDSDSLEYKHDEWYFPIFEMKTKRNWVKCDQWWCITSGEGRLHQSEWGWAIHPKRGSPGNYLDFPQSCSLRMRKLPNFLCWILSGRPISFKMYQSIVKKCHKCLQHCTRMLLINPLSC